MLAVHQVLDIDLGGKMGGKLLKIADWFKKIGAIIVNNKKKSIIIGVIAAVAIVGVVTAGVLLGGGNSENGSRGLKYTKHDGYYSVSIGKCKDEDIIIPAEHRKLPVKVVDDFSNSLTVRSIVIPDSVTEIEARAFEGCKYLESITLSKNLRKIPRNAFTDCEKLKTITLPNGILSIGDMDVDVGFTAMSGAFRNTSINDIILPESLQIIGDGTFSNCKELKSIIIPNNVWYIGTQAFGGCTGLEDITFSENVTYIENDAFQSCTSLKSIIIPKNVTHIGISAFYGCKNLKEVTIPQSVTYLAPTAFEKCSSISMMNIFMSCTHSSMEFLRGLRSRCCSILYFMLDSKQTKY